LVSCYALLAIPFGYFIKNHPQKWLKAIMVVLLALNLFQTWQTKAKIISSERMTAAYYFRIFGKTNVTDADKKLLLVQRPSDAVETMPDTLSCQKSFLQNESFENETDKQHFSNSFASAGQYSLKMDSTFPYTKPFEMPYKEITNAEYAWIRSSVSVFFPNENTEGNLPLIVVSFVNRKDESYKYRTSETIKSKKSENGWVTVTMDYMTPEVRSANDKIKIYLWYRDKQPIFVDNFTIEKFEPANAIEQ
ncbi:MAG: hypothetical protein IT235_07480, partial [Bacteroidia bacterium]|nr:hypothetical protein [Bacteroidia bacterium]